MPRARRFGFIAQSSTDARTLAHELGHGAFNLEHTFPVLPQGTTDNLMDYNGGTRLIKPQWDLIHNPELTTGLLDDETDAASTLTPMNEDWTALFNHIYKNHNAVSNSYLDMIKNSTGLEDFKLVYHSDESSTWTPETKSFIDKWKIRVLDINETGISNVLDNVISAIQNANDGEKIGKISLRPRNIYLGKILYDGAEYPIAIYGNGNSTSLENVFIKRQVKDIGVLEDKTHIYSIYCDDTPTDYTIIGFYESGKNVPSMIMQIAKFDVLNWQFMKEKWLEYLGIYTPDSKIETDGLLALYDGDKEVKDPKNFFPTITSTPDPEMPKNLKIKFNGSTGEKANVTVKISYRITYSYGGNTYPFDDGTTTIEIKDVEAGKLYPLSFSNIRGGTVTVTCETADKKGTLIFNIRGENPDQATIKKYFSDKGYSTKYWFFSNLTKVESSFMQYCYYSNATFTPIDETQTYDAPNPKVSSAGQKGLPLYGGPRGFGLKQLDNWGANKYCTGEHRWNWKKNVDGGYEVLEGKLDAKGNSKLKSFLDDIKKKDKDIPEMNPFTIGNYTFTFGNKTAYFPSYDFKKPVPDGMYSFLVAALIKMYNGGCIIESVTEHVEKEENKETGDMEDVTYLKITIDPNSITDNSDKKLRPYLFKVLDPK